MNKDQIEFVKQIMRFKIDETGLAITPACFKISNKIGVSHMTLMKAARGEFTTRTVRIMIGTGWFSREEFESFGKTSSRNDTKGTKRTRTPPRKANRRPTSRTRKSDTSIPDTADFEKTFKSLIQEAYEKGYRKGVDVSNNNPNEYEKGYKEGFQDGRAKVPNDYKERLEAYRKGHKEGYDKGREAGRQEGYSDGYRTGRRIGTPSSLNTKRLEDLLRLYGDQSASAGEKQNTKKAVGMILSKWITAEFGEAFTVSLS